MDEHIFQQATINIGTIGHVAHGKSTLVKMISGVSTIKYKSELERNITIKLGYANAKIYECSAQECPRPERYKSYRSNSPNTLPCPRKGCPGTLELIRHVSFVDCPGHDVLMATMLTGTAIMDSALLLVAANESCPQPQTQEHLFAVEIMGLKNILVIQNKIDLVSREQAIEQKEQIDDFIRGKTVANAPIIPTSSQLNVNVDAVLDYIVNYLPQPVRSFETKPKMVIIRSFDINKPGCKYFDLKGGVIGGSLVSGKIHIGDIIEIRPGIIIREDMRVKCRPFITEITTLKAEENVLTHAIPGGLIGVGTTLDPFYCKGDKLVGMVMGVKGNLPDIFEEIEVEYTLFRKIAISIKLKDYDVAVLKEKEQILLNIGSTTTVSAVLTISGGVARFSLTKPACSDIQERIAISRKIDNHWRLIGYGNIVGGKVIEPEY